MITINWAGIGVFFFTGVALTLFTTSAFFTKDILYSMRLSAIPLIIEYTLWYFAKVNGEDKLRRIQE